MPLPPSSHTLSCVQKWWQKGENHIYIVLGAFHFHKYIIFLVFFMTSYIAIKTFSYNLVSFEKTNKKSNKVALANNGNRVVNRNFYENLIYR